jgi:hypothetical protein
LTLHLGVAGTAVAAKPTLDTEVADLIGTHALRIFLAIAMLWLVHSLLAIICGVAVHRSCKRDRYHRFLSLARHVRGTNG